MQTLLLKALTSFRTRKKEEHATKSNVNYVFVELPM